MPIRISSDASKIIKAINDFGANYHNGFAITRPLGKAFLVPSPEQSAVSQLAITLKATLIDWGAGKRAAPIPKSHNEFVNALSSTLLHNTLVTLEGCSINCLGIEQGHRVIRGQVNNHPLPTEFDANLISALGSLANGLFIGATNATYPMKALLLITGLMPAFDSQVRRGLHRGGFVGMGASYFLLPSNTYCSEGLKVSRLPFLLGSCWEQYGSTLHSAIIQSKYPYLVSEPGRLFDVLLFMQGNESNPVLLSYDPGNRPWYESL